MSKVVTLTIEEAREVVWQLDSHSRFCKCSGCELMRLLRARIAEAEEEDEDE
jgi:hypothetical protein